MQSTFHGLETARRAMMTQRYALRTVGHNIANANTPGYTRQRVNFDQTEAYPAIGMNRPRIPGHLGTGVKAGSVQRIREQFLDVQYRNESNKVGYWDARSDAFLKMEDIMIETKDEGINYQINLFWSSLQDLMIDPEDSGARSVVRERGKFIAETFNRYHNSLTEVRNDYGDEIDDAQNQVNIILRQIDEINDQIRRTEPHGYVPNDLYDRQDVLLDELSQYVNIKVTREESGGQPNAVAEGPVTVKLVDDLGKPYPGESKLIDGTGEEDRLNLEITKDADGVTGFTFSNDDRSLTIDLDEMPRGEVKALIEAYGYDDGNGVKGIYPDMIKELNLIAKTFAEEFNKIHSIGFTLADADGNIENGGNFFHLSDDEDAALSIKVDDKILDSLNNIAASGVNKDALTDDARGEYETLLKEKKYDEIKTLLNDDQSYKDGVKKSFSGDSSNAKLLANMKDELLKFGNETASVGNYYQGIIGEMAVGAQESIGMLGSSLSIRDTVENNRQSVSSVSLDEEMTLMIQYQHAYNAAARNVTMVDEMLDRVINSMGIVGR